MRSLLGKQNQNTVWVQHECRLILDHWEMQPSSYLKKALFYDQTQASHEYFERKAPQLFLQPKEETWSSVELHVLRPLDKLSQRRRISEDGFTSIQQCQPDLKQASEHDEDLFNDYKGIPLYNGALVERWRITDNEELKYYADVRQLIDKDRTPLTHQVL